MESQYSRKLIGFDAFDVFPKQDDKNDADFIREFEDAGGCGISTDELFAYKSFENYELIKGYIVDTVPECISTHL